jgi:hypothetical protein
MNIPSTSVHDINRKRQQGSRVIEMCFQEKSCPHPQDSFGRSSFQQKDVSREIGVLH